MFPTLSDSTNTQSAGLQIMQRMMSAALHIVREWSQVNT